MADHKQTLKKLKQDLARAGAREVQLKTLGIITAVFLSVLVLMAVLGDPFGLLAALGLQSSEQRGAYGDCSDPANRNNKICNRTEDQSAKDWNSLRKTHGKSPAFSLTEK